MMQAWKNDVSVLLVFFVRSDTFSKVFESVKKARPRRLLLWQDGPRENRPSDIEQIKVCREIAENIDWDCEVYKHYCDKNLGCDPSTFYAFKWAFSIVDKCIILEDDQMPSQSYFEYCKELLDKYENDERISHICGYNIFGNMRDCPYDYLFSHTGSGAWASWRRVAEKWDEEYSFFKNEYELNNLRYSFGKNADKRLKKSIRHAQSGVAYWETIVGLGAALDSKFAIIPRVNLVKNLGISQNATHSSVSDLKILNKDERKIYENPANEIELPLKHPEYVQIDAEYDKLLNKRRQNVYSNRRRLIHKIDMGINALRYGKFKLLFSRIFKK